MNTIVIDDVHKSFGEVTAVDGISLEVGEGEIFGLIGPDGAGKTTLMRSVCTLLMPDRGAITVLGRDTCRDIAAIRARIGYMPQRFSLYQDLTVAQNLRFFADLFGVPAAERSERLAELYHFSRLEPFKDRFAGALSGGMKQKLALSCALIHTPELLVLDEPTYGVDPVSRKEFWEMLHRIREGGTAILVSTAYMDEADQCDRVALTFRGKVQALDTPEGLKRAYRYPLFRLHGDDLRALRSWFENRPETAGTQLFGDALHVSFHDTPEADAWRAWRNEAPGALRDWAPQEPSIEDVFLSLTREAQ